MGGGGRGEVGLGEIAVSQEKGAWLFLGATLCHNAVPPLSATTKLVTATLLNALVLRSLEDYLWNLYLLKVLC